jgi:hypothetical protein
VARRIRGVPRRLDSISDAVDACILHQRWDDLEAAIAEYSNVIGIDPTMLLFSALLRAMYQRALRVTDPVELAAWTHDMDECEELSRSRQPLAASVELLRISLEQAGAIAAFDHITQADPRETH